MDGSRFDELARALAGPRSRRGLLGSLLGLGTWVAGITAAGAACPAGQVQGSRGRCLCKQTGRPPVGGSCTGGVCTPEQNVCNGGSGACGGNPDCICSQTSAGLVCHHEPCSICSSCASDQDCRDVGHGLNSVCVAGVDCCALDTGSACLTPCDQPSPFCPASAGLGRYGA